MEAEQSATTQLNFFHKDNSQCTVLDVISSSASKLSDSMKAIHQKFDQPRDSRGRRRDPRKTIEELINWYKADGCNARDLVSRLRCEMIHVSNRVKDVNIQGTELVASHDLWEDMGNYYRKWAETLDIVGGVCGHFYSRSGQMSNYWRNTNSSMLVQNMNEGTGDGTDVFHSVLRERSKRFGLEEIEDILDEYVDSKVYEREEDERKQKESEESQALIIARKGFQEAFDGMKKELDELKGELATLKRA